MAVIDAFTTLFGSYSATAPTGQNVFSNASSVVSAESYDTHGGSPTAQAIDLGEGQPLYLNATVTTPFAGGTSGELQIISADDAALTTNVTVLASSGALAIALLAAGAKLSVPLGKVDPRVLRRYVGGRVVSVGNNSAGAIVGGLTPFTGDRIEQVSYRSGFEVA